MNFISVYFCYLFDHFESNKRLAIKSKKMEDLKCISQFFDMTNSTRHTKSSIGKTSYLIESRSKMSHIQLVNSLSSVIVAGMRHESASKH